MANPTASPSPKKAKKTTKTKPETTKPETARRSDSGPAAVIETAAPPPAVAAGSRGGRTGRGLMVEVALPGDDPGTGPAATTAVTSLTGAAGSGRGEAGLVGAGWETAAALRRAFPASGWPVYLGLGALTAVGVLPWPVALGAGVGYALFINWDPDQDQPGTVAPEHPERPMRARSARDAADASDSGR